MGDEPAKTRKPTRYAIWGATVDEEGQVIALTRLGVGDGTNVEEVIGLVASKDTSVAEQYNHFAGVPLRNLTIVPGKAGWSLVTGDKLPVDDLFTEDDGTDPDGELAALAARAEGEGDADPDAEPSSAID